MKKEKMTALHRTIYTAATVAPQPDLKHQARGHWPRILLGLGLPPESLSNRHQPCLLCGGVDRFRFDDKDGRGTYYCNQCGPGDGFNLAMKYHGWDFKRCADEVRKILGTDRVTISYTPKPFTPSQPARSQTRDCALRLWAESCDSDSYVASHPYALRKRITHAVGARRGTATGSLVGRAGADCIIVPQRTLEGELIGVECINADGAKQTFGNKGVLILGNDLDSKLPQLVCEGWATAVAILNSYDWNIVVYAGFGKARLKVVASEVKAKYPNRKVVILGEQDGQ